MFFLYKYRTGEAACLPLPVYLLVFLLLHFPSLWLFLSLFLLLVSAPLGLPCDASCQLLWRGRLVSSAFHMDQSSKELSVSPCNIVKCHQNKYNCSYRYHLIADIQRCIYLKNYEVFLILHNYLECIILDNNKVAIHYALFYI